MRKYKILFILMLVLSSNGWTHAQSIPMRVHDTTAVAGSFIDIPVYADSSLTGRNVTSYILQLSYNQDCLQLISVDATGTISALIGNPTINTTVAGKITIAGAGTSHLTGRGKFITIRFKVIHSGWAWLNFTGPQNNYFNEGTPVMSFDDGNIPISEPPSIAVYPDNSIITKGEQLQFNISGGTGPFQWSVTNPSVASISNTGMLTGIQPGYIRVAAMDNNGLKDTTNTVEIRAMRLSIPTNLSQWQGAEIEIPINTTDLTGLNINSGFFTISFNQNLLTPLGIDQTGTLLESYPESSLNMNIPGSVSLAFAGTSALTGSGILIYVRFHVSAQNTGSTGINFVNGLFNENLFPTFTNGNFNANNLAGLSITPNTGSLLAGEKRQFSINGGGIPPFLWSINDTVAASINQSGFLTGKRSGIIKVTVSDSVGASASSGNFQVYDTWIQMPDTGATPATPAFYYPILINSLPSGESVFSFQGTINYDTAYLSFLDIETIGTLTQGWTYSKNPTGKQIIFAGSGSSSFNSGGTIVLLKFNLKPNFIVGSNATINLNNVTLNEGFPLPSVDISGNIKGALAIVVTAAGGATTIDTEGGTLQMSAAVLPVNTSNQAVKWTVTNATGKASISTDGLLKARFNGTVIVRATPIDISGIYGEYIVTISNQVISMTDISLIVDGEFATDGPIGGAWATWTGNGGTASVIDGVCTMVPGAAAEFWQLQVNQTGNDVGWRVYNDSTYIFMFDAWSDANRIFSIDFEDNAGNSYKRFGLSTDPDALNGESQWDVSLTTSPTTYTRTVTFNAVMANTTFKLNIMPSVAKDIVYIDNIYLVSARDMALVHLPVAGTAASNSTICSGSSASMTLTGYSGSIQWQESANGTASWTNVTGGFGADSASYLTGNLNSTTYYRAGITEPGFPAKYSNVIKVTVDPLPASAGAISGTSPVCQGQNSVAYTLPVIANATSYVWTLPPGATGTSATNSISLNYGTTSVSGNITVKGTNSCGDGAISTLSITVNTKPANAGIISGLTTVCQGQYTEPYTVPTIDYASTYVWSLPGGATGISTTSSITVDFDSSAVSGNIEVYGQNSCGTGDVSVLPVLVNPFPAYAGAITGTSTYCQGPNSGIYTVPVIADASSYLWSLPDGASGTSITNSINVDFDSTFVSGYIVIHGQNTCGYGGSTVLLVTTNPIPGDAGIIDGLSTVCKGQNTVLYTIEAISNASSYAWTLPAGSSGTGNNNSISLDFGPTSVSGNLTVKGTNSCGDGAISILPITVNSMPEEAGIISGPPAVCQGENSISYIVPGIANALSYFWTLPSGATGTSTAESIVVDYTTSAVSGEITVKGNNSCGDGVSSALAINVNPLPASAGIIDGSDTVHIGQNDVSYTVPAISDASSYKWTLPPGASGISETNSITINYSEIAEPGNIAVRGNNSCGDGLESILGIIVIPFPIGIENNEFTNSKATLSVYPNPFVYYTNINYSLVNQEKIEISIYNQLGRKIETLAKSKHDPGNYEIIWEAKTYPPGVYELRMITEKGIITEHLVICR